MLHGTEKKAGEREEKQNRAKKKRKAHRGTPANDGLSLLLSVLLLLLGIVFLRRRFSETPSSNSQA